LLCCEKGKDGNMLRATRFPTRIGTSCAQLLLLALGLLSGCYDGEALKKQAQSAALNTSFAEVDLGQYETTLPRDPNTSKFTALQVHVFGTVPRAKLAAVKKQLATDEYRVRHETLAAVRRSTRDELSDPTLAQLRARIEKVINDVLTDAPVKDVGFYQLTLR
jgi:hypothetical protein